MRFFVTGGTGFIGSHFLKLALAEGHDVIALRRPGSRVCIDLPTEPEWVEFPLEAVPPESFRGCQALIHFAAQGVSPQLTDWKQAFDVNVSQSLSLFSDAVSAGIPHLIACGSCFEYGKSGERYDSIPAEAPLEPIGPYAASKAAFSQAIEAMSRSSSASFSILRPFHLFGEGQHESNLWPSLRKAALEGSDFLMTQGEQTRDYMPVEQAVKFFLKCAIEHPFNQFQVANVGLGIPTTIREFTTYWWLHWHAKGLLKIGAVPYRRNEIMRYLPKI